MKYCEKCGNQLLDEAIMCPKCGCAVAGKQPTKEQNEKAKNQAKGAIMVIAGIGIIIATIIAVIIQMG